MPKHDSVHSSTPYIIVIGASAGGVEAILDIVPNLPEDINAAIFVVLHMPPHGVTNLHHVINNKSTIPAVLAEDEMSIERGKIYCARPDMHLILEKNKVLLRRGPRENHYRPAVDVLFRSAALHFKEKTIGVVLSGTLNDGTSGMWTIKEAGGITITQSASDALFDGMPSSAEEFAQIDYTLPAKEMGKLLGNLTHIQIKPVKKMNQQQLATLRKEIDIAKNKNALKMGIYQERELTPYTCPDCHGALVKIEEGDLVRFRCHTGHSYTADALLAGITENIENDLWQVMRGMEEGNLLLESIGEQFDRAGKDLIANKFYDQAKIILDKSRNIHNIVSKTDRMSKENIEQDKVKNQENLQVQR